MAEAPAFAADAMLGSLARWLRLLGYDCFYERGIDDDRLIEIARSKGLIILTRDKRVARRYARSIYVPPGDLDDELTTVCTALAIVPPETPPTTRCPMCNALLVEVDPTGLEPGSVPPRVLADRAQVWLCPHCKRLYWTGTHVQSMTVRLRRVRDRLGAAESSSGPDKTVK